MYTKIHSLPSDIHKPKATDLKEFQVASLSFIFCHQQRVKLNKEIDEEEIGGVLPAIFMILRG